MMCVRSHHMACVVVAGLLLAGAGRLPAKPSQSGRSAHQAIRELALRFGGAFQSEPTTGIGEVSAMLADDCVQVTSAGTVARGKDEHSSVYAEGLALLNRMCTDVTTEYKIERIHTAGRMAFVFGQIVMAGTVRETGKPFTRKIWETLIFEKRDGVWLLVQEHSTIAKASE